MRRNSVGFARWPPNLHFWLAFNFVQLTYLDGS